MNAAREGSNRRLPGNSRTSFRSTTWHQYRDGESNPGLRVEGPASSPLDHRGVHEEAVGLAPTRASRPLPVFETGSSSGRIASEQPCVSPARFERATFAFGTRRSAPLSYGELLVSTAGVEPASSGFVDRHLLHSATSTCAPSTGLEPASSGLTGRRSNQLSYDSMCAPWGSNPVLSRLRVGCPTRQA